jgi:phage-related protein
VTTTLPFINTTVAAEAEGQIYTIRLTIDKSKITTPGEFKGKITIETNDPDTPVLEVPVQGSVG